jgi:hypothetical protein
MNDTNRNDCGCSRVAGWCLCVLAVVYWAIALWVYGSDAEGWKPPEVIVVQGGFWFVLACCCWSGSGESEGGRVR